MEGIEQQFQCAGQARAQPAHVQRTLFPTFVVGADELALHFDNWRGAAEAHYGDSWSAAQRKTVTELDQLLTEMSGDKPELWLNEGCLTHPRWTEVRQLAGAVLNAFDWQDATPP